MLVCDEHKFVFLRNPKTASRSISQTLKQNFNVCEIGPYHSQNIPKKYLNYYIFFAVRNPYTRMISAWQHICNVRNLSPEKFTFDKAFEINSIMTRHFTERKELVDSWWSQSYVIDKLKANVIFYENLENDFNNLYFVNKKITLPCLGKQNYGDWNKYYSLEEEIKIRRCFKKDFNTLYYDTPFIKVNL